MQQLQITPEVKYQPILGGYVPLAALWEEDAPGPHRIFQSEVGARWYIRHHRDELVDAKALLYHAGRLFVHPENFQAAALQIGLDRSRFRRAQR